MLMMLLFLCSLRLESSRPQILSSIFLLMQVAFKLILLKHNTSPFNVITGVWIF
jgi:hypothetical protein